MGAIRVATRLEPTGRPAKSTASIIEKLRRETIRLNQMQDITGCRLVVKDITKRDQVVRQLKSAFPRVTVADRRKQPSYGYRAVHVIPTVRNRPIEIQVRTELQHLWAQGSERLSDAFDPTIKYGGGPKEVQSLLSLLANQIASVEDRELQFTIEHRHATDLASELGGLAQQLPRDIEIELDQLDVEKEKVRELLSALAAWAEKKGSE